MKLFEERHGLPVGTVRVVSCHYFQSQKIFVTDHDPVSLCIAHEKVLIASNQHSIEVRELEESGKLSHSFPTVDLVQQLIHCKTGNYIACLEMKSSRQSIPVYYVRVYLNWWMADTDQPMKARIAGRVTPSSQPGNASLEMVEIPLKQCAQGICCCQESGNIAISIGNTVSVYVFSVKVHDISKLKFIDFNHLVNVQLSFQLQQISMCEEFIACGSKKELQVFKICVTSENYPRHRSYAFSELSEVNISKKKFVNQVEEKISDQVDNSDCIVWDFNEALHNQSSSDLKNKVSQGSWPLTVHLKSLSDENNFVEDGREGMEICRVTYGNIPAHPLKAELDPLFISADHGTYRQVKIISMLYKRIPSSTIIGDVETNSLHSVTFIPVYGSDSQEGKEGKEENKFGALGNLGHQWNQKRNNPLQSPLNRLLHQVCFFVSTPNEGYLYDFTDVDITLACQYQYTSVCKSVILDMSTLHALTEAGLETYTGRVAHCAMHNISRNDNEQVSIYPMRDDPVCLLDLRPFLNIEFMLKSENHIILISSKDLGSSTESLSGNEATVYSLQKPSPESVYNNLMELASEMKLSSPGGYQHLMMEAGMQLKSNLLHKKERTLQDLYQQWCFLLANYYLCSNDDENSNYLPYFTMSELPLQYILNKTIKNKHASKKAFLKYLKYILLSARYQREVSSLQQSIGDSILEFFEEAECEYISTIVLSSKLHYKLEKAVQILRKQIAEKKNIAQDAVAITLLLQKKGSKDSVQSVLNSLPKDKTFDVLKLHMDLLFTNQEFKELSPYGHVLAQHKPAVLARLLYHVSCTGVLSLPQVILFIQSQSNEPQKGHMSVLQCFAEFILFETTDSISENDQASIVDILASIYVKNIIKGERQSSISSNMKSQFLKRRSWLNLLPPFKGNIVWKLCQTGSKLDPECQCILCHCFLLKLQALLCSSYATQVLKSKVVIMLDRRMKGYLSIQLLCAQTFNDALRLIQEHNQFSVLLQYGVDMFEYDLEKWSVLYNIVLDKRFETDEKDAKYQMLNYIILGILGHLSEHIAPNHLVQFIPAEMDQCLYMSYLQKSCDKHQANKMKSKIVSMASELKQMM